MISHFHFPPSNEKTTELENQVAVLHAKMVIQYLNQLPYTKETKIKIIEKIIQNDPLS